MGGALAPLAQVLGHGVNVDALRAQARVQLLRQRALAAGLAAERPGVQVAGAGRIPEKAAEHGQGDFAARFLSTAGLDWAADLLPSAPAATSFLSSKRRWSLW